ncbi:hypothetical protein [Pseudorhodoferax sp. Leaf267]|uniref:hypothetical protein n=1 Tax=Pseudorhodoferax sp. Leaf267 TaxID=1736316 RepID=UPI0006FEFDF7|nr:hypothetical protein [Pseudorhodoferax sp. Leaf267]KQP23389.1 hypothetical protein ASF43_05900 [Pseudorhodoferax sp. Leaf267]
MNPVLGAVTAAVLVTGASLAAYDRWVLRPALAIGTVDLAEVYRAKEAQFAQLLTATAGEEERQQALALARRFAQRLPAALDELPRECACLVVVRTAVVGSPHAQDLTPRLRAKVELP